MSQDNMNKFLESGDYLPEFLPTENIIEASAYQGMALCKILYENLKALGIFPALTGGLLYKEGFRKDIDIVLFRHRQDVASFETTQENIRNALEKSGVEITGFYGFVTKAKWKGIVVDIFNPETQEFLDHEYGDVA